MTEPSARSWEIFFEVFEPLPRQGPGSRACAVKALELCGALPPSPAVLDLGCGAGGQTLLLAELIPAGSLTAIDSHSPNIERLQQTVNERALAHRILPLVGDIGRPCLAPAGFELIWSEGALYNVGIANALRLYDEILRPGGTFAFTEAVWLERDPPAEAQASFADYPGMGRVPDVLATIEASSFSLVGHFLLPDEAWWDDFYTPMEQRLEELRGIYIADAEALSALEQIAQEPEMHRRCSSSYGYEFFVVRKG